MEKEVKVNTKLMKSLRVGEVRTFLGRTYKEARSASNLTRQVRLTHGIDCTVKTRERVDGTYEITVKRLA